jgi:hypothetical protein
MSAATLQNQTAPLSTRVTTPFPATLESELVVAANPIVRQTDQEP